MPAQSNRTSHTAVCIAAFVIYYSLFYFAIFIFAIFIPGFIRLYQNGLDCPFLHGALLLPCSLLL
ncbi:MAG: protease [Proteobacteria bacterium]|nr:protease [Pseudomonadota bacterium]